MAEINDFIREWESDCDYIVAHTSGSTGTPKEIRLPKSDMRVSAKATNSRFGITRRSVIAAPLSVDYIAGKMMCVRAIEAGCELLEMPVSNKVLIDRRIDLLAIVPSQLDSLLAQPDAPQLVKNIIVGGAPMNDQQLAAIVNKGLNAFATYGMTETCSHVALKKICGHETYFESMPGISFSQDRRGCLVIQAPAYSFGNLTTNDIVEIASPTEFRWIGRFDNVINSGGIKISPERLEKEIARYVDRPFYITSAKDDRWGEVPAIVFEGTASEVQDILDLLASKIDHKTCPKKARAVRALPRTANGKIFRKKID